MKRLAVDATLRAAAPYQRARRKRAEEEQTRLRKVYVEKSDMRRWALRFRSYCLRIWKTVGPVA